MRNVLPNCIVVNAEADWNINKSNAVQYTALSIAGNMAQDLK